MNAVELNTLSPLACLLAGLTSALTPCVYPLIPITLAIMGADARVRWINAITRAAAYCLGMSLFFICLGLLSAKLGLLFGSWLGHPLISLALGAVTFALGFFALEILRFPADSKLQLWASSLRGQSVFGAFLMGMASAVLAAPCIAPIFLSILGIVAQSGSQSYGVLALGLYSLGLSAPLFVLAVLSRFALKLPQSGNWLHLVKFVVGIAIFALALHLTLGKFPGVAFFGQSWILIVLFPLLLLFGWSTYQHERLGARFAAAFVAAILVVSWWRFDSRSLSIPAGELSRSLAAGRAKQSIVLVDFYADWCAECVQLDKKTFPDISVQKALQEIEFVRYDFSTSNAPGEEVRQHFGVRGLPTLLFLCADGNEVPDSRISGFINGPDLMDRLAKARSYPCAG